MHGLQPQFLRAHPPLIGDLLRQMVPLELAEVLEIPHVVVVIVALSSADEGVIQALGDSCDAKGDKTQRCRLQ